MLTIAGIDASLSATGLCIISNEGTFFYTLRGQRLGTKPSDVEKNQRLALLVRDILAIIKKHEVQIAAIENYAFSMSSQATTPLAELQGALKVGLFFQKILCCSLPVSTIRKFCIGKHIPKKQDFQREFKRIHHRISALPRNEDEWDAFAVAYTLHHAWQLGSDPLLQEHIAFHLSSEQCES